MHIKLSMLESHRAVLKAKKVQFWFGLFTFCILCIYLYFKLWNVILIIQHVWCSWGVSSGKINIPGLKQQFFNIIQPELMTKSYIFFLSGDLLYSLGKLVFASLMKWFPPGQHTWRLVLCVYLYILVHACTNSPKVTLKVIFGKDSYRKTAFLTNQSFL